MAKRFTCTEKWEDPWFFSLAPSDKLTWMYLLDRCDYAGVWKVNIPLACTFLGCIVTEESLLSVFNGRIEVINGGGTWFIPKFITFQYGQLNPKQVMHRKVIATLDSLKSGLGKGYVTPLEEEEEEEEEKEEEKKSIYKDIVSDLNEVTGSKYKYTGARTRALIKTRLNEGFTVADFKKVHRNKHKEWGNDKKMMIFLRPETLYSNKFEGYLNQKQGTSLDAFCEKLGVKDEQRSTFQRNSR